MPVGADGGTATITPELIRAHAYSRKRFSYSLRPNSIAEGDGSADLDAEAHEPATPATSATSPPRPAASDDAWWGLVEELELNHQHLRKLHGLERLGICTRCGSGSMCFHVVQYILNIFL